MSGEDCKKGFSDLLFWDVRREEADMDKYPAFFVQRVLEYGGMEDWRLLRSYYGLERIVEICKGLRTLDPMCLSFICTLSDTNKEDYRCYHTSRFSPTPWNS